MSAIGWLVRKLGGQRDEDDARRTFEDAIAKVDAERAEFARNVRIMNRAAVTVERSLASVHPTIEETPEVAAAAVP